MNRSTLILLAAALAAGCATHGNPIFPWQYYVPLRTSKPFPVKLADLSKEQERLVKGESDLFARLTTTGGYEKVIERMSFQGEGFLWSQDSRCYNAMLDLKEKALPPHPTLTKKQRRTKARLDALRRERGRFGAEPRQGNTRVRLCQSEAASSAERRRALPDQEMRSGSGDGFTFKIMLFDKVFVHGDGIRLAITKDDANDLLYVQFDGASFRRTYSTRKRYEPAPPMSGAILGRIKSIDSPPEDPAWWDGMTRGEWKRR